MSQEPSDIKKEKNNPLRPGGRPEDAGKKGPKFSIYWIYAIIFAVLVGFNLFNPLSGTSDEITPDVFVDMLKKGEVKDYTVISNRNKVEVTLTPAGIDANKSRFENSKTITSSTKGPHFAFNIVSGDSFKDDMRNIR